MAVINLDEAAIKSLNTEISSLDQALISSYFPDLASELSAVRSNVQNAEINQILTTIETQVDTIKGELSTELPRLEEFLDQQLSSYITTEAEAEEAVMAVVGKMAELAGVTSPTSGTSQDTSSSSGTGGEASSGGQTQGEAQATQTQAQPEQKSGGRGDKYVETWSSWLNDVSDAYKDTNGLVSAVGNTAEVILDTGGALVETVANGVSDGLGFLGNAVSWVLG